MKEGRSARDEGKRAAPRPNAERGACCDGDSEHAAVPDVDR